VSDQDSVWWLIAAAAACMKCGEEHRYEPRVCACSPGCTHLIEPSWAHPSDGHPYQRRALSVEWMREWATTQLPASPVPTQETKP